MSIQQPWKKTKDREQRQGLRKPPHEHLQRIRKQGCRNGEIRYHQINWMTDKEQGGRCVIITTCTCGSQIGFLYPMELSDSRIRKFSAHVLFVFAESDVRVGCRSTCALIPSLGPPEHCLPLSTLFPSFHRLRASVLRSPAVVMSRHIWYRHKMGHVSKSRSPWGWSTRAHETHERKIAALLIRRLESGLDDWRVVGESKEQLSREVLHLMLNQIPRVKRGIWLNLVVG